jgi:hypothetical protein
MILFSPCHLIWHVRFEMKITLVDKGSFYFKNFFFIPESRKLFPLERQLDQEANISYSSLL